MSHMLYHDAVLTLLDKAEILLAATAKTQAQMRDYVRHSTRHEAFFKPAVKTIQMAQIDAVTADSINAQHAVASVKHKQIPCPYTINVQLSNAAKIALAGLRSQRDHCADEARNIEKGHRSMIFDLD